MNRFLSKVLSVSSMLAMLTFSGLSSANVDKCAQMPGKWEGNGRVKVFFFTCEYKVDAVVAAGNPANANVTVTKTSGNRLCPNQSSENVVVSCNNGYVEMKSEKINIDGVGSDDGLSVSLSGTINVMYKDHALTLDMYKRQ